MLKKDLTQLKKLLKEYSAEVLKEGCDEDNMELVKLSNYVKRTVHTIEEIKYIHKSK